jgi:hypothetical protein
LFVSRSYFIGTIFAGSGRKHKLSHFWKPEDAQIRSACAAGDNLQFRDWKLSTWYFQVVTNEAHGGIRRATLFRAARFAQTEGVCAKASLECPQRIKFGLPSPGRTRTKASTRLFDITITRPPWDQMYMGMV